MLGLFEISIAGVAVSRWTSLKGLTVFKYLLAQAPRPVRRDVLMEFLWPGYRPQSARNNLNVAIYSLRRSLDEAWADAGLIAYRDGSYQLSPDRSWWVDLKHFRGEIARAREAVARGDSAAAVASYAHAVALYRGPLFEDGTCGDWHLDEQRTVQEQFLAASEALAALYLGAGDVTEALATAQEVVRTDPCRESTHRLLMRCFALLKQRQLVARQFQHCAEALDREFGLRPAGETLRLYRELTETA